jgi:DNA-binding beta-propeller fold protein YncE
MTRDIDSFRPVGAVVCIVALTVSTSFTTAAVHAQTSPLITPATQPGGVKAPLDATPSPAGDMIYFTAKTISGKSKGVFSVVANGGKAAPLFVGAPFVTPAGIAMSLDGSLVFVADAEANGVFVMNANGTGQPGFVPGTQGTSPRNIDVVSQHGQEMLYFTGRDAQDGQPALFMIPAGGAAQPAVVFKGAPLNDADGVAVAQDGTAYVADHAEMDKVFKIAGGAIVALVDNVRLGNPGGIALTSDGSTLLVSSFQANSRYDQVLVVDTASGATSIVTDVVGKNRHAGGIHRAHNTNVFAWADLTAGGTGRVYRVSF